MESASNVPIFAGVLAGIVGGLVVGALSGSHTSVSGPAAGLTAVIAAQVATLGSFQALLLAIVIAGFIQIGLGVLRAGSIAAFVPASVIKGLLAAIGLILILKQIPHLLGHDTGAEGEMSFQQVDHENTFSELLAVFGDFHVGAAVIGIVCLALLVLWGRSERLKKSGIPSALVVVLVGVGLNLLLRQIGGTWYLAATHLVNVPIADSLVGFVDFLQFPDVSAVANPHIYMAAFTIAIVASLETLLNVEAVDKLDTQRRSTPANRELLAQGAGNVVAGLIGGLPVTSVIVRSSVNISSGGKTKLATLVHGALLLLSVLLFPKWLNLIPLSCLAAVLIVTGLKLAKPALFKQMWDEGLIQFLPFVVTVLAILFTDLLIGILVGLGFSLFFILHNNLRRPVYQIKESHISGDVLRIELADQVSFLNRASLTRVFDSIPRGGQLLIDARRTNYIDADVLDLIWEFVNEVAPVRGVEVSLIGLREHYDQLEDRVQYVDFTTRDMQDKLTPEQVLQILREGNERFRAGQQLTRDLTRQLEVTADVQHPLAIVLSGASSRTPVEMIFDVGLGDLYCARVISNFISRGILGSLEHATVIAGAKLIVVMGHSNSAACRLAIESHLAQQPVVDTTHCPHVHEAVTVVQQSLNTAAIASWPSLDAEAQEAVVDQLYRDHIHRTIEEIRSRSAILNQYVEQGQIDIVGAMYSVRTGEVDFFN